MSLKILIEVNRNFNGHHLFTFKVKLIMKYSHGLIQENVRE